MAAVAYGNVEGGNVMIACNVTNDSTSIYCLCGGLLVCDNMAQ